MLSKGLICDNLMGGQYVEMETATGTNLSCQEQVLLLAFPPLRLELETFLIQPAF